jgi:hypothetical protein
METEHWDGTTMMDLWAIEAYIKLSAMKLEIYAVNRGKVTCILTAAVAGSRVNMDYR